MQISGMLVNLTFAFDFFITFIIMHFQSNKFSNLCYTIIIIALLPSSKTEKFIRKGADFSYAAAQVK